MTKASEERPAAPGLVRGLSAWDGALVTIGSILGGGIFLTTGSMARLVPHEGLLVALWVAGGVVTLAGALTYAELGALYPRAGGQYEFLKVAYGPLWGFLFGWAAFFVIMSGGIATLAVGFGDYLGVFLPFFSTGNVLFTLPLGPVSWTVSGGQLAGAAAIVLLTALNYIGLREGAFVQNVVTLAKIGSLLALGGLGLIVSSEVSPDYLRPLPGAGLSAALGVAMVAVVWSYDGWYAVTNLAGEMRRPERDLPVAIVTGTLAVTLLYALMNVVYLRALPVQAIAESGRIGEAAATVLFGPLGGRLISAAVLVSTFGCISSTILYAARIYLPMAQDGVFFARLAEIHPRFQTPSACLVAQGLWATALTFSGSYEQLYTYVVFAVVVFHAMTGAAVMVLRRRLPDAARPYRTWGYPWVPLLFIASSVALVLNTLVEKPRESGIGLLLILLGLPAYARWRRAARVRT
ncbi:MAG TPA: APC family permease [Vicinamibacteria bacterium]|nr:APC family permease [Vicinamibacteria bacterium]